jgi:serralysin
MKSKFITDSQTSFGDDVLNTIGDEVTTNFFPNFFPAGGRDGGNSLCDSAVEFPLTPALTSEAVQSSSAQSGTPTVVATTSGGITINLLFDAAAMAAPASFRAGIRQAASLLTGAISDKITVNIKIDYSGTGGGAAAGPDNGQYQTYSSVRADLINNATPGDPTFNALPGGSPIQGQTNVAVWNAQLKLWGLLGANDTTTDDGSATFATDISSGLLVGVALHELTHAMGRVPYGPPYGSQPDILDLFRFTSPGTRLIDGNNTAPAAYFSVDGGNTKLADFGQNSDPSDFLNSGVQGGNDPFNEYYTGSTLQSLTAVDKELLDALGFHTTTAVTTTVIESFGSTELVQVGSNYFLDSVSSGSGPELKFGGALVVAGQYGGWAPIGAERTAGGYDVAWKNAGLGLYTLWTTDSSGNHLTDSAPMLGTSYTLESLETVFNQDLNGDGVIGPPTITKTVIQTDGSTSLAEGSNQFYYLDNSSGSGPELQLNGAPVVAGQFGAWAPISAVQTAGGYDVAWKNAGLGLYTLWTTDSSGNHLTDSAPMLGASYALESLETVFNQDLNGDGVIGPTKMVIQTDGPTSLTQIADQFFLNNSGGVGPALQLNGAPVVTGQFGAWTPIGAVQTAGGYDVAWNNASLGLYTLWTTDSSGNHLTDSAPMMGTSLALESLETVFNQDLNGDGVIGPTKTVIQTDGPTSLTQVANEFFLDNSSGVGPALQLNGAPVVAGQFGAWAPIGAVQTAGGYDVAWKNARLGLYTYWTTDTSGNHLTDSAPMSGTSYALESLETVFNQDLNGDGVIGPTKTAIQTDGLTSLVEVANQFYALDNSSGVGPTLQLNGAPVAVGQFGAWTPIGAVQTAGGYDVAWKNASLGLYTYWTTDSSGNHLTDSAPMSGTSLALESVETVFHEDINGDGVIGLGVDSGAILNISTANAATVTFANNSGTTGELLLSDSKEFTGSIVGFTGNGTLSGSDQIDLSGLNFNSGKFSDSYSNHILTVSDGTNTVQLDFAGVYSLDNFSFASDGQGGTIVYDPPISGSAHSNSNDSFVFKASLGQNPIANFQPAADGDTFVSGPSTRASVIANAGPIIDDRHVGFFHDARGGQPQIPFHSMSDDGRAMTIDANDHESAAAMNFHFVYLQAAHLIIG